MTLCQTTKSSNNKKKQKQEKAKSKKQTKTMEALNTENPSSKPKLERYDYDWRVKSCELKFTKEASNPMLAFVFELVAPHVRKFKGVDVEVAGNYEAQEWIVFFQPEIRDLEQAGESLPDELKERLRRIKLAKDSTMRRLAELHSGMGLPMEIDPDNIDPTIYQGKTFNAIAQGTEDPDKDASGQVIKDQAGKPILITKTKVARILGPAKYPEEHTAF